MSGRGCWGAAGSGGWQNAPLSPSRGSAGTGRAGVAAFNAQARTKLPSLWDFVSDAPALGQLSVHRAVVRARILHTSWEQLWVFLLAFMCLSCKQCKLRYVLLEYF